MSTNTTPRKAPKSNTAAAETPSAPSAKTPSVPDVIQEEQGESSSPATVRQAQMDSQDTRREYGTISSNKQTTAGRVRPTPSTSRRVTSETTLSLASPSPQVSKNLKPPTLRRGSTRRGLPHRGESFSVDDDPSEVEEDRTPLTPSQPHPYALVRQMSTVRRKTQPLPRVDSQSEDEEDDGLAMERSIGSLRDTAAPNVQPDDDLDSDEEAVADDEDDDLSDAESFTLKDRQLAINETHPFGIRIWKPALYKKNRSVEKTADQDIHSSPSQIVSLWLWGFNFLWTILFGWWLAIAAMLGAAVCYVFAFDSSALAYGSVFWSLAWYLFWPFGKFVKLEQDENYVEEDEGEGRSVSEYERWQRGDLEYGRLMFGPTPMFGGSIVGRNRDSLDSNDDETESLLGRSQRLEPQHTHDSTHVKRRLFGRGQWTLGRVIFFVFFYFNLAPLMLLVSMVCWFMVFWIPMGRVLLILFSHVRRRPLSLTFHRDVSYARSSTKPSSILLCTYRAVGTRYWKYTIDGTNIFLINFLAVVAFAMFDYIVLKQILHLDIWLTSSALLFTLGLVSIIPLAYFIGQAVASISAQSSMGVGAAVNAFFSTIVEVYLYCVALNEGKGALVEGSVIGSIFAGILLLPGLSMCFGAIKRKTQRFNVRSASATTTMLLFAVIGAFGPTLFYKIYGAHELICRSCNNLDPDQPRDCRQCYFRQVPAVNDDFFVKAVRPYCWIAAVLLFSSYMIGLLFTLRTHAAVIWSIDIDEKRPTVAPPTTDVSPLDTRRTSLTHLQMASTTSANGSYVPRSQIRDSQLYKRILGQSLRQAGLATDGLDTNTLSREPSIKSNAGSTTQATDHATKTDLPHVVPPKTPGAVSITSPILAAVVPGLTEEQNTALVRQVAEMAATAATAAAREAVQHPRQASYQATHASQMPKPDTVKRPSVSRGNTTAAADHGVQDGQAAAGHDAPNWSRTKSSVILLTATVAYAVVAEILVNTVDVVLDNVDIGEKFLGITLFALVPNTTEFLNGISFAMHGNIALSMEIGSAYALQVCLLQIPALVLFSAVHGRFIDPKDLLDHTFNLIFPQWDMVTVILCVFLLTYMISEGKSNYFKGSILVLTYLVVIVGFYYASYTTMDVLSVDPSDTLAIMSSTMWQSKTGGSDGRGVGSGAQKISKRSEL